MKSGMVVSSMTLISRVLGLVRDVVIANLLGAGVAADVFYFALKIPNFLRRLFAEGAFAQAFVPVLASTRAETDDDGVRELVARVSGTLGTLVMVVTLLGVIGSPVLTALFGAGWFMDWLHDGPQAQQFALASLLLKITFPYLFFITLTALSGAILNTYGKFAVAAFTPVFLNVALITSAIVIAPHVARPEYALAGGVFCGGLIQLFFQLPFLARAGFLVRPKWGWHHPGVTRIRQLMIPALFGVSVSQINLLLDTMIASFLVTGSISWLYYADRLLEFPLGLFGIAIATVILPALSNRYADKSNREFASTMDWGVRMVMLLGVPAAAGLMVLAQPILMLLFMRGAYDVGDVAHSGAALLAYGSGLVSFMMVKVLAPGYYSRQDTKTPVKFGIIAMLSNMGFNAIFAYFFSYVGLAIATSLSALINAALLYIGLHRGGVYRLSRSTLLFICRVLLAALTMAVLIYYWSPALSVWQHMTLLTRIVHLLVAVGGGLLCYSVAFIVLGGRLRQVMRPTS